MSSEASRRRVKALPPVSAKAFCGVLDKSYMKRVLGFTKVSNRRAAAGFTAEYLHVSSTFFTRAWKRDCVETFMERIVNQRLYYFANMIFVDLLLKGK
jgi:hypothetical protein